MKTLLAIVLIICCAHQLKAQAPTFPKMQPLPDSLTTKNFSYKKLDSLSKLNNIATVPLNRLNNNNAYHMPIVRTPGSYNMPVVQTDVTAYTMPVAGKQMPQVYIMTKPKGKMPVAPAASEAK